MPEVKDNQGTGNAGIVRGLMPVGKISVTVPKKRDSRLNVRYRLLNPVEPRNGECGLRGAGREPRADMVRRGTRRGTRLVQALPIGMATGPGSAVFGITVAVVALWLVFDRMLFPWIFR